MVSLPSRTHQHVFVFTYLAVGSMLADLGTSTHEATGVGGRLKGFLLWTSIYSPQLALDCLEPESVFDVTDKKFLQDNGCPLNSISSFWWHIVEQVKYSIHKVLVFTGFTFQRHGYPFENWVK